MKYNPLIDDPPETVMVNEKEYTIKTDFKKVLSYLRMLEDKDTSDQDKTALALYMFFGKVRETDIQGLIEYLRWYMKRGKDEKKDEDKKEPTFDILVDSARIYAAFFQTYHINLRKVQMHWWTFMDLLEGLPKGTHLADVIDIRGKKIEKWMKAEEINNLVRLKEHYAIVERKDAILGLFDSLREISG